MKPDRDATSELTKVCPYPKVLHTINAKSTIALANRFTFFIRVDLGMPDACELLL